MKIFVSIICAVLAAAAWGQDAAVPAEADGQAPAVPDTKPDSDMPDREAVRPSLRTEHLERGTALARFEDVVWFEAGTQQRWLAVREAQGAAQGAVLLVAAADAGANGFAHLATLRRVLPNLGWSTYYLQLPADGLSEAAAVIDAARTELPGDGALLMMCEGLSCDALLNANIADVAGTAFINVGLTADTHVSAADKQAWREASTPALVLQERPLGWPATLVPATGFELHLLPPGNPSRANSKVVRKLRGWLRRSVKTG